MCFANCRRANDRDASRVLAHGMHALTLQMTWRGAVGVRTHLFQATALTNFKRYGLDAYRSTEGASTDSNSRAASTSALASYRALPIGENAEPAWITIVRRRATRWGPRKS
jgi:hypothetical protein